MIPAAHPGKTATAVDGGPSPDISRDQSIVPDFYPQGGTARFGPRDPTIPDQSITSSPSVWAWRPGPRARDCAPMSDHVLAPAAFSSRRNIAGLRGPAHAAYVGHPLTEQIGGLRPRRRRAKSAGTGSRRFLLVLPGKAVRSEINHHMGVFGENTRGYCRAEDMPFELFPSHHGRICWMRSGAGMKPWPVQAPGRRLASKKSGRPFFGLPAQRWPSPAPWTLETCTPRGVPMVHGLQGGAVLKHGSLAAGRST